MVSLPLSIQISSLQHALYSHKTLKDVYFMDAINSTFLRFYFQGSVESINNLSRIKKIFVDCALFAITEKFASFKILYKHGITLYIH